MLGVPRERRARVDDAERDARRRKVYADGLRERRSLAREVVRLRKANDLFQRRARDAKAEVARLLGEARSWDNLSLNQHRAIKQLRRERRALIQMMERIAEDVLPAPVRYADLTPRMVLEGFIKAWADLHADLRARVE